MRVTPGSWCRRALPLALCVCALCAQARQYGPPGAPPPDAPPAMASDAPPPPPPLLAPGQLDALVAPIALYPDPLLSQILAACTYPLEIVEAARWSAQNRNLQGEALVEAARQQEWDPSVAALVAFPDVLHNLDRDVQWTSDLGNAFLAQQGDVMDAVQRLRQRAQASGMLNSSPQETVSVQVQGDQSAIDIEPADPQMLYVPQYDPELVWGAPVGALYPAPWYPDVGFGLGFASGVGVGWYFGGCCGWNGDGWGWRPRWFDRDIYQDNQFLARYGYQAFGGGNFHDHEPWQHDPRHRLGVPYPTATLTGQYGHRHGAPAGYRDGVAAGIGAYGGTAGVAAAVPRAGPGAARSPGLETRPFAPRSFTPHAWGSSEFERANPGGPRSVFSGSGSGGRARLESDRGFAGMRGAFGAGHAFGGAAFARGGAPRSAPIPARRR